MRRMGVVLVVLTLTALVTVPGFSQERRSAANLLQYGQSNVSGERVPALRAPTDLMLLVDQPPNQASGVFSDARCDLCGGAQVVAENFALAGPARIEEIVLWTGYYPTDTPIDPDVVRVVFHADGGGIPGAILYDEVPVAYDRVQTGVILFGVHEWMHTLTLATPLDLVAGTYWVEIYNDTGFGTHDFFWEVGDTDPNAGQMGSAFAFEAPGQLWAVHRAQDLAFQLWGTNEGLPPCEWQTVFYDGFEAGFGNWAMDGLWHAELESDACGSMVAPFPSPVTDAYFGQPEICTYFVPGVTVTGTLVMSLDADLSGAMDAEFSFFSYEETECDGICFADVRTVDYSTDGGGTWYGAATLGTENVWYETTLALPAGKPVRVRFHFDSGDRFLNSHFGWMVDSVEFRGCLPVEPVFATHVRIVPLGAGPLLLGIVRAATGDGSTPVAGATVDVDWTIPPGGGYVIAQTRTTNANGLAFPVMNSAWTGTYVLDLVNIDAAFYTYEPADNWEDTATYVRP